LEVRSEKWEAGFRDGKWDILKNLTSNFIFQLHTSIITLLIIKDFVLRICLPHKLIYFNRFVK